ncbi:hypothetical protein [Paenibacillus alkalitolerans]|uniref:hypothetical protein n=1 Tax=Paenibacillus alkalitolerans TaxID=2799335 RepID=UPI0018F62D0C|nr:hypothetical protein [Paenibacillus alkalitolerans]
MTTDHTATTTSIAVIARNNHNNAGLASIIGVALVKFSSRNKISDGIQVMYV